MKRIIPAALLLFALAGLFCLGGGCDNPNVAPRTETASTPDERIPVKIATVELRRMALPFTGSGMLSSSAEQRLSFKIGGVIHRMYVQEGDVVRPGQLLAALDKTEIDAQVNQANQALAKAERDLARVEGLYNDSSATLELLQNATTGRDIAREAARIASFNQQYAEIRASRGGKIIRKLMNEGEICGPGMPVFVLFESGADDWVVKINVSDRDWARIQTGMTASVRLDAYPETVFQGRVSDLAPAADPASGLYTIEISVRPGKHRFAPGLFARVELQPPGTRSYAVLPIEALMEGDGRSAFVFALQPDRGSVRKVPVEVAFLDGDKAVLRSELEAGQEVVTAGAPYLTDQKKVIVQ